MNDGHLAWINFWLNRLLDNECHSLPDMIRFTPQPALFLLSSGFPDGVCFQRTAGRFRKPQADSITPDHDLRRALYNDLDTGGLE